MKSDVSVNQYPFLEGDREDQGRGYLRVQGGKLWLRIGLWNISPHAATSMSRTDTNVGSCCGNQVPGFWKLVSSPGLTRDTHHQMTLGTCMTLASDFRRQKKRLVACERKHSNVMKDPLHSLPFLCMQGINPISVLSPSFSLITKIFLSMGINSERGIKSSDTSMAVTLSHVIQI